MSDSVVTMMQEARRLRFDRPQAALRLYADAITECRQQSRPRELIQALKGQGQVERDLGQSNAALTLYEEAASLCRKEGDARLLAHTLRHVADIHQVAGRNELALPFYEEALAIYRRDDSNDPLDLANTVRPLAALKENLLQIDEAKRLWQEAKDLYAASNIPQGVAECSRRLDRLESHNNNQDG